MTAQRFAGAVSRALPGAHGVVARWLERHPTELVYRDADGLMRTADLRDDLERAWFAGVQRGLPRWVRARIPAHSLAIDIGANVGTVTGQLALAVGPSGRTLAIEPVPRNIARIEELARLNNLPIEVLPVAAGAVDGALELRLAPTGHSGWASATASWIDAGRLAVPLRSLDSLMRERRPSWPLAFVKIDVEGYEAEVLSGGRDTLAAARPLLYVEFNDLILRDRSSSSRALLAMLGDFGYRPSLPLPPLDGAVVDVLLHPG